jgi:hypothetical protein
MRDGQIIPAIDERHAGGMGARRDNLHAPLLSAKAAASLPPNRQGE